MRVTDKENGHAWPFDWGCTSASDVGVEPLEDGQIVPPIRGDISDQWDGDVKLQLRVLLSLLPRLQTYSCPI